MRRRYTAYGAQAAIPFYSFLCLSIPTPITYYTCAISVYSIVGLLVLLLRIPVWHGCRIRQLVDLFWSLTFLTQVLYILTPFAVNVHVGCSLWLTMRLREASHVFTTVISPYSRLSPPVAPGGLMSSFVAAYYMLHVHCRIQPPSQTITCKKSIS